MFYQRDTCSSYNTGAGDSLTSSSPSLSPFYISPVILSLSQSHISSLRCHNKGLIVFALYILTPNIIQAPFTKSSKQSCCFFAVCGIWLKAGLDFSKREALHQWAFIIETLETGRKQQSCRKRSIAAEGASVMCFFVLSWHMHSVKCVAAFEYLEAVLWPVALTLICPFLGDFRQTGGNTGQLS